MMKRTQASDFHSHSARPHQDPKIHSRLGGETREDGQRTTTGVHLIPSESLCLSPAELPAVITDLHQYSGHKFKVDGAQVESYFYLQSQHTL